MHPDVKFTEQVAADIRARVKTLDFKAVEKIKKAKDTNGTFDVIISTESIDRSGEIIRQNGWDFGNYKNNPIVLYGHNYYELPIGICTELYETEKNGVKATGARGVFYPADINPMAQQVRRMYDFGIKNGVGTGCTTSVGFIVKEYEYEPENTQGLRATIVKAELLEFSFVSVPANQDVGPAEGRALTFSEARELKLDTDFLIKRASYSLKPKRLSKKTPRLAMNAQPMTDHRVSLVATPTIPTAHWSVCRKMMTNPQKPKPQPRQACYPPLTANTSAMPKMCRNASIRSKRPLETTAAKKKRTRTKARRRNGSPTMHARCAPTSRIYAPRLLMSI